MGKFILVALAMLGSASAARADYSILCGENRSRGVEQADVAVIDTFGEDTKVYVAGKLLPGDVVGLKFLEGHQLLLNIDQVPGKTQRFTFFHQTNTVQETFVNEKNVEKKVGKKKKCDWVESDPPGAVSSGADS